MRKPDGIFKKTVNLAFVGLSGRGISLLELVLDWMPDVQVIGVCDEYADRAENARDIVVKKRGTVPVCTTDYHELLHLPDLDGMVTPSAWDAHIPICIDFMKAGVYAASEVGGAYSVQQCWDLVRTYEETGIPMMLLENCCYGREEMTVLNMVKQGVFGELIHAEGGYRHDLREEVGMGHINRHYRQRNYQNRNGELYPTHELGPIAKWLNINRGNRMLTLVSMASKAAGVNDWIRKNKGPEFANAGYRFAEGDVVTTLIKCAHGETITLVHDTTLPRPYSRANVLQGTNAIWSEDKRGIFIDGVSPHDGWDHKWESIDDYFERYEHPLWKWFRERKIEAGHGGMDFFSMRAFVEAVKNGTNTPIDVYDAASWMVITVLSEESVAMGGMPVAIPDFTNGRWTRRETPVATRFSLDEIPTDLIENYRD